RVMTGGSVALGFGFDVVVVVEDPEPLVVVVVEDDDEDDVVEALSALRPLPDPPLVPPPSPPSDWGAVVDVDDAAGVAVATRWRRGPLIVSMAMISTWRASPAARTWAWVAPWARISSDRTGPPAPSDSRSWSARSARHGPQTRSAPARRMSTAAPSLPAQRTPRCDNGNGLSTTGPGAGGTAGPAVPAGPTAADAAANRSDATDVTPDA